MNPEDEVLSGDEAEGDIGLHTGRIVPIYEAAGKVTTRVLRSVIDRILGSIEPLDDNLPQMIRESLKLPDRWSAIQALHFPAQGADLRLLNAFRTPAHWQLIFEEFFWLECGLAVKKCKARVQPRVSFELTYRDREKLQAMLAF